MKSENSDHSLENNVQSEQVKTDQKQNWKTLIQNKKFQYLFVGILIIIIILSIVLGIVLSIQEPPHNLPQSITINNIFNEEEFLSFSANVFAKRNLTQVQGNDQVKYNYNYEGGINFFIQNFKEQKFRNIDICYQQNSQFQVNIINGSNIIMDNQVITKAKYKDCYQIFRVKMMYDTTISELYKYQIPDFNQQNEEEIDLNTLSELIARQIIPILDKSIYNGQNYQLEDTPTGQSNPLFSFTQYSNGKIKLSKLSNNNQDSSDFQFQSQQDSVVDPLTGQPLESQTTQTLQSEFSSLKERILQQSQTNNTIFDLENIIKSLGKFEIFDNVYLKDILKIFNGQNPIDSSNQQNLVKQNITKNKLKYQFTHELQEQFTDIESSGNRNLQNLQDPIKNRVQVNLYKFPLPGQVDYYLQVIDSFSTAGVQQTLYFASQTSKTNVQKLIREFPAYTYRQKSYNGGYLSVKATVLPDNEQTVGWGKYRYSLFIGFNITLNYQTTKSGNDYSTSIINDITNNITGTITPLTCSCTASYKSSGKFRSMTVSHSVSGNVANSKVYSPSIVAFVSDYNYKTWFDLYCKQGNKVQTGQLIAFTDKAGAGYGKVWP